MSTRFSLALSCIAWLACLGGGCLDGDPPAATNVRATELANSALVGDALPATGMTAAQLNTMFGTYGDAGGHWTGGDSTASVRLPDGRIAWVFSDTFLGTVNQDGTRPATSPMVNNTLVVQDSGTSLVATLHGGTAVAPKALVIPDAGTAGEYWVGDGTVEGGFLKVLYNRYEHIGSGPLDVELRGTALAVFALPGLTLSSVTELPLGSTVAWGSAILDDGDYTYVYGSSYVAADRMKFGHVARVPAGGLGGPWQFWTGSTWSTVPANAARLLSGVGTAYAVQKVGGEYVLITMEGNLTFNPEAVAYTATSPTGPWSGPIQLFTAPEPQPGLAVIVYDTRLHPELASAGKLLVSYNVNSLRPEDNFADARLYRPRFVDLDWPPLARDPASLPGAPTGLTVTADDSGIAHLTWQSVTGAQNYRLYEKDVTAGQTHFARSPAILAATSTDFALVSDHTHEFRVSAVNAVGEGPLSSTVSVTKHIAPPPAPTGLTAIPDTAGRITVSWAQVPSAWNYEVYRRDVTAGEAGFSFETRLAGKQTSLEVDNLEHNHQYAFYLVASHGGGSSPPSETVSATAFYALPSAPTGLVAVANADGTIGMTWTAPAPDLWYLVYMRDVTAGEAAFTQLPLPITSCCAFTAGYLMHGHEYEFKIAATNRGGVGPASNPARAVASYPVPAPPGGLSAAAGDGQAVLSWSASATPGVWYFVYQRDVTAGEPEFTQLPLPIVSCCTMTAGYLANGHIYEFKVTAIAQRESPASNVVQVTPQPTAPDKPTGLTATANSNGTVTVAWVPPAQQNLWFNVYQRDVTAGQADFAKLPLPITTCCAFTAGFLVHNHVYQWKVSATNGAESPLSDPVQATAVYALPPAPTNLRGVSAGDGNIALNWDGPSGVYFWIYWRDVTAGQTAFTKGIFPTDKTEATLGLLVNGHVYEFRITAANQAGEGPPSGTVQVTAQGGLPAPPSNLVATAQDGQVLLSWTASPTQGAWYWVYMRDKTAGQSWQKLPLPISSCCSMTAGFLSNGNTYEFKVTATNWAGDSSPSNVATARPLPPIPKPPTNLAATPGDGKVVLNWTASPSPNVWYWVEMSARGGEWQRLEYPVTTCCSLPVIYLVNGTTYDFRLRSTNLAGDSSPSNVATARPMPPFPQPPTGLTATPGDGRATLHWSPSPTSNVWYLIDMRPVGGEWQRLPYPVTTCCTFVGGLLTNGTSYEFRVRATNVAGVSAPSNVVTVRPMPPVPRAPTGLSGETWLSGDLFEAWLGLTWTPSSTPFVTHYLYYKDITRGATSWTPAFLRDISSYQSQYYEGGHVYDFRVSAKNMSGETFSSTIRLTAKRDRPAQYHDFTYPSAENFSAWDSAKRNQGPWSAYHFDWSDNSCSVPLGLSLFFEWVFERACVRHDFGYRNHSWSGVDYGNRKDIDDMFLSDARRLCDNAGLSDWNRGVCNDDAWDYYFFIRRFGEIPW